MRMIEHKRILQLQKKLLIQHERYRVLTKKYRQCKSQLKASIIDYSKIDFGWGKG